VLCCFQARFAVLLSFPARGSRPGGPYLQVWRTGTDRNQPTVMVCCHPTSIEGAYRPRQYRMPLDTCIRQTALETAAFSMTQRGLVSTKLRNQENKVDKASPGLSLSWSSHNIHKFAIIACLAWSSKTCTGQFYSTAYPTQRIVTYITFSV
jgi:hypothetical protein